MIVDIVFTVVTFDNSAIVVVEDYKYMQFTLLIATGNVLHRCTSQEINRLKLLSCLFTLLVECKWKIVQRVYSLKSSKDLYKTDS